MTFELDAHGVLRFRRWMDIPWLVHGFTTRRTGDFSVSPSPEAVAAALGIQAMNLSTTRQVHSDGLVVISVEPGPQTRTSRAKADGLLTRWPGHLLGVRTADCLPILLVDRAKRGVAAIHAGWRGTLKSIARRAVRCMTAEFASREIDIEAAIGPSIGPCCFEVGPEVASRFEKPFISGGGSNHVDLVHATRSQLFQAGMDPEKIFSANACTHCLARDYFSHRRGGDGTRRMLAFVGVRT